MAEYRNVLDAFTGGHISSMIAEGICVICHGEAKQFNDALSKKEHQQSGLCQHCQDDFFDEREEDNYATER